MACISCVLQAQENAIVDKIIAQVGDKIILKSDVETYLMQEQSQTQGGTLPEDERCQILQDLVIQKLMLIQADKDSITVTDEQVESDLDGRIRYFESLFGSQEKMEEYYGKSVAEIKEEFRDDVRNLDLIKQMQQKIFGDVSVSPSETRAFFNQIPKDSVPYINAEVEVAQIIMFPKPTAEQKAIAKEKAENLRQRILNGESFSTLAKIYSQDEGTRDNGGYLGCQTRESFVPEFSAAAFRLKPGEISEVVETQFGYHIIKMESRQGDKACLWHILIEPNTTNINITIATKTLDSIRSAIADGKLSFCKAASLYSDDEASSHVCGDIVDNQTGSTIIEVSQLDPDVYYAIEKLKPGEISQVLPYTSQDGKKGLRIILLKSQTQPHVANLKDDYARIQAAALSHKQIDMLNEWVDEKIKKTYLNIDSVYSGCDNLTRLTKLSAASD